MAHIHEMELVQGGARCMHIGCGYVFTEKEIVKLLNGMANEAAQQSVERTTGEFCGVCQQIHPENGKCHNRNIFA